MHIYYDSAHARVQHSNRAIYGNLAILDVYEHHYVPSRSQQDRHFVLIFLLIFYCATVHQVYLDLGTELDIRRIACLAWL